MNYTKAGLILLLCIGARFSLRGQAAPYTMGFIPASIEEVDVAFPLYQKWHLSGQVDGQMVTQGAYSNSNPFAYVQRAVARPWIIYSGLKNMKLWLGYAHNKKYEIAEAGNYETLEQRLIIMGTLTQPLPKGSLFEQVRFETKFFDDRNGEPQTVPRLRARFGVNHFLAQHSKKPWFQSANISYYAELMLKFPQPDYANSHFDIFRMSVYYSAGITPNLHFLIGGIGQMQLRTNDTQFDVYYGPLLSFKYNFVRQVRETFDNIDGGAD
ncbi:DUF2490 domain-containing protein [Taibaiella soli]|uniref:DUF2490 domain-containing protein n=1 Tax=Taibaiella soli TaxID=1649169 RepID=A0A2W2B3J6_9BACT|nr:DUF2490 domain-containing protein [Taibaiella soli]PZF74874.1 hypothetical protein DN068_01370 [Taibaiella soli]